MFATGVILGVAEWIIDDTFLVVVHFGATNYFCFAEQPSNDYIGRVQRKASLVSMPSLKEN